MTQIEKDREFLDEVFYQMRDGGTQIINDISKAQLAQLFDLAHRLLTERDNAEVIYKDTGADPEFWTEDEIRGYKNHMKFTKGVWIPDGEAENK